jgi:hypothetical protein
LHRRERCVKTDRNDIRHDSCHLGVPSGASNTISEPTVRSTQTMDQSCRTELPLKPHHLGVPSGTSKMFSKQMVCSVQTVLLSCTNTNTVSKCTKTRFHTTHVTYEFHQVRPKPYMMYWYVQCKPCSYLASRFALSTNGPNRAPLDPRHLGVPSVVSKLICEPMVHLTQTEHLSCTNANTVSKHIETRFYMTHITSEFHVVPPILFPSKRYVRRKPCTNLAEPSFHLSLVN